jgi:hypothetical protein
MGLPPLRIGLLGVAAVLPGIVTAYALSRSECAVAPSAAPHVASATAAAAPSARPSRPAGGDPPPASRATKTPRAAIDTHIAEIARRYRLSEHLVAAVIAVESEFDPRAVSRRGARGLMQLMPDTAARLGVRDPFDPRQNIDGGARYLRDLMNRFSNNLPLALAAYNAGHQAVVVHGGIPPYPETREFVRRVMSRIGMAEAAAVAMASARPSRVASLRFAPATATLRPPLNREPAASPVSPAVVRVSLDDMPYEALVLTVDLSRDAGDIPRRVADRAPEPAERQPRRTPAKPADVPSEPITPSRRGEPEAP